MLRTPTERVKWKRAIELGQQQIVDDNDTIKLAYEWSKQVKNANGLSSQDSKELLTALLLRRNG